MWQLVVCGVIGAAVHRVNAFLEVNRTRRRRPLRSPEGPDGRYYLLASALHCLLAAVVTWAATANGQIMTVWHALVLGAITPTVLAKFGRYALGEMPPEAGEARADSGEHEGDETDAPV
jgi:hypothetical protein